ncbi:MAG TPA: hypothetical protein VHV32_19465 [Candidatus Angelobacter sp.]|nr:hypothetical protein [Candidatus Angelobacter sp.]
MPKQKTTKTIIRYWHPRLGGWYHATLIRSGYKWAVVQELVSPKRHRVAISDVKEVA